MLQIITGSITGALNTYQDRWARDVVSTLSTNMQEIFNKVAEGKLVGYFGYFDDSSTFHEKAHTFDVAVLKVPTPHSSENSSISIEFYVGGKASDTELAIKGSTYGNYDSVVKVQDVVSPILLNSSNFGSIDPKTLDSDFGRCIRALEKNGGSHLSSNLNKSFPLLEQVVSGTHPHFEVISKAEFDRREHIVAKVFIEDIEVTPNETLLIFGNGTGMDNWKKGVPMHRSPSYPNDCWELSIRGNKDTKYKLALLRPDGSIEFENRETAREIKDTLVSKYHDLSPLVFNKVASSTVKEEEWEVV